MEAQKETGLNQFRRVEFKVQLTQQPTDSYWMFSSADKPHLLNVSEQEQTVFVPWGIVMMSGQISLILPSSVCKTSMLCLVSTEWSVF